MQFLRCVHAEVLLVTPRLARTPFGIVLLALGLALVWLGRDRLDAATTSVQAGALGAVIAAAYVAGDARDRAAFTVALSHPTTPLAIALGRWLAMVLPAIGLTLACAFSSGAGLVGGSLSAAAVGACALALVLAVGQKGAAFLFLFIAIAGTVPPERFVALARPGLVRIAAASVLELGPFLWHYRDAVADSGAVLHGLGWMCLGVLFSSSLVGRRRLA